MPARLRVLGTFDTTLLWTNLGISLLVLVLPAYFDLPLKTALAATLVGAVIGNGMLAVAALIGADARVPTMVLQRAPLGRRGSYLATALNILQCLGWAVFELIVIATAAGLLCDKLLGFQAVWLWKLVFGVAAAVLALLGPVGFVRRFVRKFAIWAVALSIAYLVWWIPAHADLHELWRSGGSGGSFFAGMDLIIALSVSWIPLCADYTRFSTGRRAAFWGAGLGYLFPTLFQFGFGAILVLSHPSISGPVDVLTTIAEVDSGTGDEILDRRRDENFSWLCEPSNTSADRDGDAGDLVIVELALARVEAGAHLKTECAYSLNDRFGTADRSRGAVEAGEEAVTGGVHLLAAVADEVAPDERVVAFE